MDIIHHGWFSRNPQNERRMIAPPVFRLIPGLPLIDISRL